MKLVQDTDFPDPIRDTPELRAAFRAVLAELSKEYPPDDSMLAAAGLAYSAVECRDRALMRNDFDPVFIAHWASDTGVPNEKIMATYLLLFT